MRAAITGNLGDAIHHQHGGRRKLGVAGAKQVTCGTFQKVVFVKAAWKLGQVRLFSGLIAVAILYHWRVCEGKWGQSGASGAQRVPLSARS